MINFGIKKEKTLAFLRSDVKSVITYKDGKKESQSFYNENGDTTLKYYFNKDESIRLKQETTFKNGYKTGYINYDEYNKRDSYGQYELDQFGQIVSKYHNGELEEQYQYNELGQITVVFYTSTGSKDIYEYDENNLVIKQLSVQGENSLFGSMFSGPKNKLFIYENDNFGNIVKMKCFDYDSKQLLVTEKNKINEQGDEIENVVLNEDGSVYLETFSEYEYDNKKNWVIKRIIDKEGNIKNQTKRQILYYS